MGHSSYLTRCVAGVACAVILLFGSVPTRARADDAERTSVIVVVKDAETDNPIAQARLTLKFSEPGGKFRPKSSKPIAFSAKTNSQGRYRFSDIPKGTIVLIVTADRHQSYGKEMEVEQDNQVIEVKMKKPQPLL